MNREALIALNQAINKYLNETSEDVPVVEMSKKGQIDDWAYDPDFDADEPRYLTPPVEQAENWHVDPPEERESLCDEWEEEEDVDLGWSRIEVSPEFPAVPNGLGYWLDAVPIARTPEESESILEAIERRQSENWSTKPDWQYGDSI